MDEVLISRAKAEDADELLALLSSVNLPPDGVAEHLEGFLLARDSDGRLIGCVGLERYGRTGLLRSAAVSPERQAAGLGSRLTAVLLDDAEAAGLSEIVLLTTTARDFFVRRFGFIEAARADYDERLRGSIEWRLPRCASAALLKLDLKKRKSES